MNDLWLPAETTTHQDHVIAHVVGTTVLAYWIIDDAVHLLLDIGFIWKVYVNGEMGLLPHPVAVAELDVAEEQKQRIAADIDLLLRDGIGAEPLAILSPLASNWVVNEVEIFTKAEEIRLDVFGEKANLQIELAPAIASIRVVEPQT